MFNKQRKKIEETIHVTFDESRLPNPNSYRENEELNQWANSYFEVPNSPIADPTPSASISDGFEEQTVFPQDHPPSVITVEPISQVAPTTSEAEYSTSSEDISNIQSESAPQLELNSDPLVPELHSTSATDPSEDEPQLPALRWTRSHPIDQILGNPHSGIKTRHQTGNICLFVNFLSLPDPKKIDDALFDPFWVAAMQEELSEFEKNKVWKLVPRPSNKTVIGTKWVFRNKLDANNTVTRNKARLVG